MNDIVLKVENLSKLYRLGEIGTGSISHDINRWWANVRGKEDPYSKLGQTNDRTKQSESDYVWALKDIDFEVKRGDVLGVIGKNGAGKSTLLKILSQITSPSTGFVKSKGRVASLLEVGTGMHEEMTARENIYLNGAILGMQKKEISRKFDEIVEFSGCALYLDTPIKRFSSGMRVRLGFAVAAFLEPEILIVDEVLAVGDAEFQKKAINKMKEVSLSGDRTILFVSHNMASVRNLCTKGLVLNNGQISFTGSVDDSIAHYLSQSVDENTQLIDRTDRIGGDKFKFSKVVLKDQNKQEISECISGDFVQIDFHYQSKIDIEAEDFHWGISLYDKYDVLVFGFSSIESGIRVPIKKSKGLFSWKIPSIPLRGGQYYLRLFSSYKTTEQKNILDLVERATILNVHPGDFWNTGTINRVGEEVLIQSSIE